MILGIVVASTGLGIIWLIWFMIPGINYSCIRQPKYTHAVAGKGLIESNIGFQVEPQRKEQCSGDASRRTHRESIATYRIRLEADCP